MIPKSIIIMADPNNSQVLNNSIKGKITYIIVMVLCIGITCIISAIVCWVGLHIYPAAVAWNGILTNCSDIFTRDTTFNSWLCYMSTGLVYMFLGVVAAAFINLMMWPFHVWQRNNIIAIGIFVLCLIPFYIFGLQLMGVMATKITADLNMTMKCNLDSYYELMNNDCLWYGIVTEIVVIGIELGIAGIVIVILHVIDHMKKSGPVQEKID